MRENTNASPIKWEFFSEFFIYLFIFLTGTSGLIYQVVWHKYLSRMLGSDNIATAIILASFLGGLSVGYYLCGRLTTRTEKHFRTYAILEGIIGLCGLGFPYLFSFVYTATEQWSFTPPLLITVQGLFCSVILMGLPTMAMGGTVPLLTRAISRNLKESTDVHARIYAINTAGACLGALLAGFYLIPQFGLPTSLGIAAVLNLASCAFFFALAMLRGTTTIIEKQEELLDSGESCRIPATVLYVIAFLSGFYVMTLENVLIRITGFSIGSSAFSFSLIIAVFIFCIALGSISFGRWYRFGHRALYFNQLTITVSLLLLYLTLDSWPYWGHVIRISLPAMFPGMFSYYALVFAALLLVFLVPVGCMGATVPMLFHEIRRELQLVGRHSGFLFSLNTLGSLVGSLAGGMFFYYFFNHAAVFSLAIGLAALSTCLAGWNLPKKFTIASLSLCVCAVILIFATPFYIQKNFIYGTFRIRKPLEYSFSLPRAFFEHFNSDKEPIFYEDGPVSTVSVFELPVNPRFLRKPRIIAVNGKSDSSTIADLPTIKLLAHLPALLAESRKKVLVIGLGTGVTAGEMSLYNDAEDITVAEISSSVVKALGHFDSFNNGIRSNPRLTIRTGDAFRILAHSQMKWDIIISEPSNPWVSGVDSLFSKELYRRASAHLNDRGLFAQWAHYYDSSPVTLAMIANTMRQEFRFVRAFLVNQGDLVFLGSNHDFTEADLKKADLLLKENSKVRESLDTINLGELDAVLLKEIWSPSYIDEYFSDAPVQTLDHPRLHYIAGKEFFLGSQVPEDFLYSSSSAAYRDEYLLARKYPGWKNFPLSGKPTIISCFPPATLTITCHRFSSRWR